MSPAAPMLAQTRAGGRRAQECERRRGGSPDLCADGSRDAALPAGDHVPEGEQGAR